MPIAKLAMLQKINYKATLEFLSLSIHTLDTGIQLEIDADLFLDKILEDILFTDSCLSRLFHQLRDNPFLNRRLEYLSQLEKTKEKFIRLINRIISKGNFLSEPLGLYLPTLKTCLSGQTAELASLRALLEEVKTHSLGDAEVVISPLEYKFLLELDEPKEGSSPLEKP